MEINLRDATKNDIPFITSTWLNSLWGSKHYKNMKKSSFMEGHHNAIKSRISEFSCIVACDSSDPYVIYGYLVYNRPNIIQFAYVKGNFRGFGICKKMLQEAFRNEPSEYTVTHITDYIKEFNKNHRVEYNPYKFFDIKEKI